MKKRLLLLVIFSGLFMANAAEPDRDKWYIHTGSGLPWAGEITAETDLSAEQFVQWYLQTYFPSGGVSFELVQCQTDRRGNEHCRYQQTAAGFAVNHGVLNLHIQNGKVYAFNGELYRVKPLPEQIPTYESTKIAFLHAYPQNRQRIFPDEHLYKQPVYSTSDERGVAVLCYRFRTADPSGNSDDLFFFDLKARQLIRFEPQVVHTDSAGRATTFFRGTRPVVTDFLGSNRFRMKENKRPLNTYDASLGNYVTDSDNVWDTKGKEIAGDVHWGMGELHNFMKQKFGWNSYANRGDSFSSVLNFSSAGNAFWNLSGNYATFLVNNTASTKPCAALDVVGHEFGHGIADENAGLVYTGEACMLHESFADISGALLERYVDSTTSNWLIGDEVWSGGIRNIQNPKAFKHPMTYKGSGWGSGCHGNGGVQNYWFYLMAMGDTGTNDNGLNYALAGLGIENATQIIYHAMFYYVTPNTTFPEMAGHTLRAVKDLFGSCGPELKYTWDAWNAVGIKDSSVQLIDLSHGIVAPNLKCASLPTDVHYRSLGDRSRKVHWDFGNGDTTSAPDVRKTYAAYGTYRVLLLTEVCNKQMRDTLDVQINHQPEATFSVNKSTFCLNAGDSLKAVSNTANPDSRQTLYNQWILNPYQITEHGDRLEVPLDGKPYNFTLELVSYYKTGCSSKHAQDFEIHPVPKAKLQVTSTCEGLNVPLKNLTDTTRPLEYHWSIGNGSNWKKYFVFQPQIPASDPGSFTVHLQVIDTASLCGSSDSGAFTVFANPRPSFSFSNNCLGDSVRFIHTTSHPVALNWFQWNFGVYRPFNKEEVRLPAHTTDPWIVSVEVLDKNGCKGKITDTIPILFIKSDFELPDYCLNDPKPFANKSEGSQLSYHWDFGDGATSTEENPRHAYTSHGTYQVLLTAISPDCRVTKARELRVKAAPTAHFSFSGICAGDSTRFEQLTETYGLETMYFWQFGDGDTSTESAPAHFYDIDQSTTYSVQLRATNSEGCVDQVSSPVTINSLPHCGFTWQYDYPDRRVYFAPDSLGYKTYSWEFGDGNRAEGQDADHKYTDAMDYKVLLTVTDMNGCSCQGEHLVRGMNLSIPDLKALSPFLYPNPVAGSLNLGGDLSGFQTMSVFDPNGRLISTDVLKQVIDVSQLPAGTYFIQLSGQEKELRLPFVRQN